MGTNPNLSQSNGRHSESANRIPLTQGKFALVDAEDYERVAAFKWHAVRSRNTFYAMRSLRVDGRPTSQLMHTFIMGIYLVDHEDRDGLNNQRSNLRPCTRSQNQGNAAKRRGAISSKYKGVCWNSRKQKWHARIYVSGKAKHLGVFFDEHEAARAYDAAALAHFGTFAVLNLPGVKQ